MTSWFLSTVNPWLVLLALVLLMAGVGVLYRAWQQPKRHWPLIGSGWGLLILAHWPWFMAMGVDRGWALAAMLPGLGALLVIIGLTPWRDWNHSERRPAKTLSTNTTTNPWHKQLGGVLLQALVIGVLSLSASLGIALAVFALLDASVVNRTITAAIVALLVWPALMVWGRTKVSLLKPALWFIGLSLGGWLFTPVVLPA